MDKMLYQTYEARRHTTALRETLTRICKSVFPEPNVRFHLQDGPWYRRGPAEQVRIEVYQKSGCCGRKPVCEIQIARPRTKDGTHEYTQATAVLLDVAQQAGNTRLLGHLQRHCPFLPKFEVSLNYPSGS